MALLDTGAQRTCISPNVVESLSLFPTEPAGLTVASGETIPTHLYEARVDLPIQYTLSSGGTQSFLKGGTLEVLGLPYRPDDYDVLLGMDLIRHFHITLYNGALIMSN